MFSLRGPGFQRPARMPDLTGATGAIRLEFGLRSGEPRQWTGEMAASPGEIASTWGWHFIYPDRIVGTSGWDFTTRLSSGGAGSPYRAR